MSEWVSCPLCADSVHNSLEGWTRHTDGPRHHIVAMGLSPDEAERVIQACADAGLAYETAMALLRESFTAPAGELQRRANALREFARQAR